MKLLRLKLIVLYFSVLALTAPAHAEGFTASVALQYPFGSSLNLEGYAAYAIKVIDNLEVTGRVDVSNAPGLAFTVFGQYAQGVYDNDYDNDAGFTFAAYGRAALRYSVLAPNDLGLLAATAGTFAQYKSTDLNMYGNLEVSGFYFVGRAFTVGLSGNVYVAPQAIFPVLIYAGTDNIIGVKFNSYLGVTLPLSTTFFIKLQGGWQNDVIGKGEGFYVRLMANINTLF
jgi:hypothetical protein